MTIPKVVKSYPVCEYWPYKMAHVWILTVAVQLRGELTLPRTHDVLHCAATFLPPARASARLARSGRRHSRDGGSFRLPKQNSTVENGLAVSTSRKKPKNTCKWGSSSPNIWATCSKNLPKPPNMCHDVSGSVLLMSFVAPASSSCKRGSSRVIFSSATWRAWGFPSAHLTSSERDQENHHSHHSHHINQICLHLRENFWQTHMPKNTGLGRHFQAGQPLSPNLSQQLTIVNRNTKKTGKITLENTFVVLDVGIS